jgi:predicted amidohydrolase YtcJ
LVFNHIPEPTAKDYEAMLTAAMHHQLELGITSATDPGVLPNLLAVYREMDAGGRLLNRLNVMAIRRPDGGTDTLPLPEPHLSDHLRVDTIKFFADGGLSGATAAVSVPFLVTGGTGVLRFEPDELFELARDAHLQGLRIGIHAIGDRAIEVVLSVYEKLYALAPGQRHRIEHLGLPTPSQLERVSAAGIIAVPQTVFIYSLGPNFRRYVPAEMLPACYPVRDMLDAGITVALSSDAPVVKEDNPLIGLQAAVTRQDFGGETIAANQAITAEEALYAYTMGGAIASGDADNRGSITVGKWADFAILSDNPLRVDSSAISQIKVEMTLVGGQVVYES